MVKRILFPLAIQLFILCSLGYAQTVDDYFSRGISKQSQKDFLGAIAESTQVINLNPEYAVSYFCRGICNAEITNHERAIADFKGAVDDFSRVTIFDPNRVEAYYHRALAKHAIPDYYGAIEDFSKVLSFDTKNKKALFNRALSRFAQNDYGAAVVDFEAVIELDPTYVEAYYFKGMALYRHGYKSQGCIDLVKAKEMGKQGIETMLRDYCNQ